MRVITLLLSAVVLGPPLAAPVPSAARKCDPRGTELALDTERSVIRWRGTKFWGLGKHEGTVRFKAGAFCVVDGVVRGAYFEADMGTIDVTDIPADDPEPRRRLRDHLRSEDFFAVSQHPLARFILRTVKEEKPRLYTVSGDLTIRGRTHPVTFYARGWTVTEGQVRAEGRLTIDRHQYGVSYRGSTIKDDLVDDEFFLDLAIEARPRAAVSAGR
ncbi:MAG: YceI family protein [Gemmatimonadales bacterium]